MKAATFHDIIEINDRFHDSALLQYAVKVRLFDFLVTAHSSDEVAQNYRWLHAKTQLLLNALVSLGLLEKSASNYQCTMQAVELLTTQSSQTVAPVVDHQRRQWEMWGDIDAMMTSNGPHPAHQSSVLARDKEANETYNTAMRNLSIGNIDKFLAMGLVHGEDFVLDLAGGHGFYLAEIVRRWPRTCGVVWELAAAAEFAQEALSDKAIVDRVDIKVQDIGAPGAFDGVKADLIMLNNCLQYFSPDIAARIVSDCVAALRPAGRIVITAVHLDDDASSPEAAAKFAFNMMMNASGGGLHTTASLMGFIRDAGLVPKTRPGGSLGVMDVNVIWGELS